MIGLLIITHEAIGEAYRSLAQHFFLGETPKNIRILGVAPHEDHDGGEAFRWPAGTYVSSGGFDHIMMAMPVEITKDGCTYKDVEGTPSEMADLKKSYEHLCAMRDEVIGFGVLPPVAEWNKVNPHL